MTKLSKIFIAILIIFLSGCNEIPLPEYERCTILSNGAICTDKRLVEGKQEYELSFNELRAYQCTNINDYEAMFKDIINKRKELLKLRRKKVGIFR